jgi:arylsulfatase A-like enzyme
MDFMPTVLELTGARYPPTYRGHTITPYTGTSFTNAWIGNDKNVNRTLYNEHFRARFIRDNEWKLVSLANDTTWHLYKIHQDETELNDMAAQHPDIVQKLARQWRQWANTHQVFPKP